MAIVGQIAWKALGWAMPGLSAAWLYLLAGGLGVALVASVAFLQGREGKAAAIASERAACELSKAEDAQVSAETLAHLLDRIAKLEDDDEGKSAKELCASSPFCRNRGKK
jgi:hypothetical protein